MIITVNGIKYTVTDEPHCVRCLNRDTSTGFKNSTCNVFGVRLIRKYINYPSQTNGRWVEVTCAACRKARARARREMVDNFNKFNPFPGRKRYPMTDAKRAEYLALASVDCPGDLDNPEDSVCDLEPVE